MTSEIAIVGLTYRGNDLQSWPPGIFLEITEGLFDGLIVVGADQPLLAGGVFPRNRTILRRKVTLLGPISSDPADTALADQRASFVDNCQLVETWFDPTQHGNLVATLRDGTTRTLDMRPEASPLITDEGDLLATFSCVLQSYSTPHWTIGP